MTVVDASVWVAALVPRDAHHVASRDWLERELRAGRPLATPELAVIEVAGAIARRTGSSALGRRAAAAVLDVPALALHALDAPGVATSTALAAERRLRGADAVYLALARILDAPLLTWDDEQIARAEGVVRARRPD